MTNALPHIQPRITRRDAVMGAPIVNAANRGSRRRRLAFVPRNGMRTIFPQACSSPFMRWRRRMEPASPDICSGAGASAPSFARCIRAKWLSRIYIVPEILKGGAAVWMMGPRTVGNDLRLEHETALLDLAAGQKFLRDVAGFDDGVSPERPAADRWLPFIASRRGCPAKSGSGNLRVENRPALIKPVCQSSTASFSSLRIWAKGG